MVSVRGVLSQHCRSGARKVHSPQCSLANPRARVIQPRTTGVHRALRNQSAAYRRDGTRTPLVIVTQCYSSRSFGMLGPRWPILSARSAASIPNRLVSSTSDLMLALGRTRNAR